MKKVLFTLASVFAISAPAFAANGDAMVVNSLDSKQEVAYTCTAGKQSQKLTAMYGVKNGEIVVAQVKVNNVISTGLWRSPNNLLNVFESRDADGTIWTTLPATAANVRSVDGGKLSIRQNGQNMIVLENCKLDKAATAKLK